MISMLRGKPRIAITTGDPCGIGPEVLSAAIMDTKVRSSCEPIIIGNAFVMNRASEITGSHLTFRKVSSPNEAIHDSSYILPVFDPMPLEQKDVDYGRPTPKTAQAVISYIETATRLALEGRVDAICTGPINKSVLAASGFSFPGHTEFLQYLTGASHAIMMLAGPLLRVSLVTVHVPLEKVSSILTTGKIFKAIEITGKAMMEFFGIGYPHIAVCGLNPHAGESGKFGREEFDIIGPAVRMASEELPFQISGPHPPDTLFFHAINGFCNAVISMYHDQGLIPIKLLHFHDAVNVTLGLPIIRTSVDHGTAYDIAGKGTANPGSMKAAMSLAARMAALRLQASSINTEPNG